MPECTVCTPHNQGMSSQSKTLTGMAFATLLLVALMMGANHVAARFAFNNGVDVVTAVSCRSTLTALVVGVLLWRQKASWATSLRQKKFLLAIGALIAVQSVCLYSAVARLPVALAFDSTLFTWLRVKEEVLMRMPFSSASPPR